MNRFDYDAINYDQKPMHIERAKAVAGSIKKHCKINKDFIVADFGCGTGLLGLNFVNDVKHIDMIDSSPVMHETLLSKIQKNNIDNVTTLNLDITTNNNIPKGKYDLIMTLMTFHHIPNIKMALQKLKEMLKPGGCLALCDLDEEDGSYHQDSDTIHNGINQTYLKNIAESIQLNLIVSNIPYIINKNIEGNKKNFPVFMHLYKK